MRSRAARLLCGTLVALLAAPAMPVSADDYTIRCESKRGRYQYCRADTDNRVELRRDYSNGRCRQWQTWGFDRRGVWVDDGCRAEFRVGKDSGGGAGTAVAVGAIAGVAVLAAVLASKSKSNEHTDTSAPPSWAVGRFRGYDPAFDALMDLDVSADGKVRARAGDQSFDARLASDHLHIGAHVYKLSKNDGGFKATRVDDSKNVVYYNKVE